ncbi:coiled-coil domain-containing protein 148-like [Littorina saxatilis]|uniref:Coiled-coil domain-containing protein 148 n=1 Tax=Littorina saxatilis TaxID=31220 RepID=A0AAN9BR84_9CAEN
MGERGARAFTTNISNASDPLINRMLEGFGSNKYKPVDYGRLKALASEKKFASLKTQMKMKKIEKISKANKESSILKQHQLVWQKEFLRLQHLRRKYQSEVESHVRHNAESEVCGQIYRDFEYQETSLSSTFEAFKQDTADPVCTLRDDLRYWLMENREDLKMGDPEVIEKHTEIRDTVDSVKAQQAGVLEKLRHEQNCLEQELDSEELRSMCPPSLEKHAAVHTGIPTEAIDLDCLDLTLKSIVLQEFLILDEKYQARINDLMMRHALALELDECGEWDSDDHFTFVAIHDQYPRELPNRRTLLFDRLKRHLPAMSRTELSDHEDWWMDFKYLKERIKGVHNDWARDRRELMTKVKLTFQEATLTHQLDELRTENVQRQRQLCQALYQKVREWREKKVEAMQMEAELEAQHRKNMAQRMKAEEELEKKRRLKEKEKIQEFQAEKQRHQEQEEAELRERLEALKSDLAEQAVYDQERIHYRHDQLQEKLEVKRQEEEKKMEEEEEREQRLEALREQVRVVADSDPARTMQETKAWHAHHTEDEDHEYINIQKPLFDMHSFTSKQITSDPRMRLENKLREAGLHNSEYARSILSTVKPLQAPRKDMLSTLQLKDVAPK